MIDEIDKVRRELEVKADAEVMPDELADWEQHPVTVKLMSYCKAQLIDSLTMTNIKPEEIESILAERSILTAIINWKEKV